jgi:hypothetical protein
MKLLHISCSLLTLLCFAGLGLGSLGGAAASGSAYVFKFQGLSASAGFDQLSPDGCIDNFVGVDGTQGNGSPAADVFIGKFDMCTNTQLEGAYGFTTNPNFQVGKKLDTASLSATISVYDWVSGTNFDVSVNQTWTANGPVAHQIGTNHFQTKGFIETFHYNDDFRPAGASGTVSDGTTNYTPSPSSFAQIASYKNGDVSISHS